MDTFGIILTLNLRREFGFVVKFGGFLSRRNDIKKTERGEKNQSNGVSLKLREEDS